MWAGGKTRMIKRYTASGLLPESSPLYNTSIDTYIEPFFGGGAMFLHINKILKPKTCFINDINHSIVNIYTSISRILKYFKIPIAFSIFVLNLEESGAFAIVPFAASLS